VLSDNAFIVLRLEVREAEYVTERKTMNTRYTNYQYLRVIDNMSISAAGVTATLMATYIDPEVGVKDIREIPFNGSLAGYDPLRGIMSPHAAHETICDRLSKQGKEIVLPDKVYAIAQKGDQGGRLSWVFVPRLKDEFIALSFYVNNPTGVCVGADRDYVMQFLDGDHCHEFARLLETCFPRYEGISDFATADEKILDLQKELFPILFGVNPDFRTEEQEAAEQAEREAKGAAHMSDIAAIYGGKDLD